MLLRYPAALLLGACLSACVPAANGGTSPAADLVMEEQVIRGIDRAWAADMAAKDPDRVARYYAEDAIFHVAGFPSMQGWEAIRQAFAATMSQPDFDLTFQPTHVEVAHSGDMAYELGTFRDAGREGKYVVVWQKINGEWKVVVDVPTLNVQAQ